MRSVGELLAGLLDVKIAVVGGGPSVEAEVSRISARAVVAALAAEHEVTSLELDTALPAALHAFAPAVVFPACHGAIGEDGSLQGLLEVLRLPYVGSGVLGSALAMDKGAARLHFVAAGLPVAPGRVVTTATADAAALVAALGRRIVVKPAAGGSALGVTRLVLESRAGSASNRIAALRSRVLGYDLTPLEAALGAALEHGHSVLCERFMAGDEVTCGVLDLGAPRALPATRIEAPGAAFYDYEARYAPGKSVHVCPAPYPPALLAEIQRMAVAAHVALGCRDLSRVDFVCAPDSGTLTVLEVNTMPGFTPTSLYPEAAAISGLSFAELCSRLVQAAVARGAPQLRVGMPFPGAR